MLPHRSRSGLVTNVVSQSLLPVNMALSMVVLKTVYKRSHYVGAVLAVYGVVRAVRRAAALAPTRGFCGPVA